MPLQIVRNDIVKMNVDAVVNTANPEPVVGRGTDSAIYIAAGYDRLLKARKKIGRIEPGEAALTRAYDLSARYIIHTVGPVWRGGDLGERETLRSCYRKSLELAKRKRCRSVAFPLISYGIYEFPRSEALDIATDAIRQFLQNSEMEVYLVVFGREEYELSGKIFDEVETYIDDHYVYARQREEYPDYYEAKFSASEVLSEGNLPTNYPYADALMHAEPKGARPVSGHVNYASPDHRKRPRSLDEAVAQLGETFPEMLFRLIDESGLTDVEVYKRANIDRKLFSKIRSRKGYKPGKKTAIALAIALRLNLDQTKDLLSRAGYALSPACMFDVIVEYFIMNGEYDIDKINIVLFDYHEQLLGA